MVLGEAANALLGAPSAEAAPAYAAKGPAGEKRQKLRRYEHTSTQFLDVAGVSPMHECGNKSLWNATMGGNKSVAFYSEYCAKEAYRQGIAGSRHAETMLGLGKVLDDPCWKLVLQPAILARAIAEFAEHKDSLTMLNGGKATQVVSKSLFGAVQKQAPKEKAKVMAAADKVYDWLRKETSAMRGFLQIMSWGGVFYASMCSDKISRCAVDAECGAISKERYAEIMVARLCGDGPVEIDDTSNAMASVCEALLKK